MRQEDAGCLPGAGGGGGHDKAGAPVQAGGGQRGRQVALDAEGAPRRVLTGCHQLFAREDGFL